MSIINRILTAPSQLQWEEELSQMREKDEEEKQKRHKRILRPEEVYNITKTDCAHPFQGLYPCRQCHNCLTSRQRLWTERMQNECDVSKEVLSFTLTFTDAMLNDMQEFASSWKHYVSVIPGNDLGAISEESDHVSRWSVVQMSDFSRFMKRLRANLRPRTEDEKGRVKFLPYDVQIKYFAKGEYGDANGRPHYHVAIFANGNIDHDKLVSAVAKSWYDGLIIYKGETTYDFTRPVNWYINEDGKKVKKVPKVHPRIMIEPVDRNTLQYKCKYITKASLLEIVGVKVDYCPERIVSSKRLGMKQIAEQTTAIRQDIDQLLKDYPKLIKEKKYKTFADRYEACNTIFKRNGKAIALPTFVRKMVFNGYYSYPPQYESEKAYFWNINADHEFPFVPDGYYFERVIRWQKDYHETVRKWSTYREEYDEKVTEDINAYHGFQWLGRQYEVYKMSRFFGVPLGVEEESGCLYLAREVRLTSKEILNYRYKVYTNERVEENRHKGVLRERNKKIERRKQNGV